MAVPYTFANATTSIPLSQLDSNFATAITLGNTATYLGNTVSTISNLTLGNVTISSGSATVTSGSIGGNVTINTTGTANTGNTIVGGTLGVTSDFAVATNKFTVAASTGNTSVAGTLGVTGTIQFSSSTTGATLQAYTGGGAFAIYSTSVTPGNQNYSFYTTGSTTDVNASTNSRFLVGGAVVANASSTGLAVAGGLSCTGAISKGSGSFRITHPLLALSETHQLVHSFIEGPQADLLYRGVVKLVNGTATINIDQAAGMTEGTFEALCRDVQCFTTNESDWTPVRGSVSGNILSIEAKDLSCTASISWMVIGERKDKHMYETDWTDENGKVIVEPLKPVEVQQEIENDYECV
jgi:hypothetical protein